jgi:hypothetical protein
MDLSTCVNRYGPAPAAVLALHRIQPADIVLHPYDAADQMIDLYRWSTDVRYGGMIAGRGASEFIWAMGRELDHHGARSVARLHRLPEGVSWAGLHHGGRADPVDRADRRRPCRWRRGDHLESAQSHWRTPGPERLGRDRDAATGFDSRRRRVLRRFHPKPGGPLGDRR